MAKSAIELWKLREIGWAYWDPIGLKAILGGAGIDCVVDEYDAYLLEVASQLSAGSSDADAIDYLLEIEFSYMALGSKTFDAASQTVKAVRTYLDGV